MSNGTAERKWLWYLHGDVDVGIVNHAGQTPDKNLTDEVAFEYTAFDFSAITDEDSEVPLSCNCLDEDALF